MSFDSSKIKVKRTQQKINTTDLEFGEPYLMDIDDEGMYLTFGSKDGNTGVKATDENQNAGVVKFFPKQQVDKTVYNDDGQLKSLGSNDDVNPKTTVEQVSRGTEDPVSGDELFCYRDNTDNSQNYTNYRIGYDGTDVYLVVDDVPTN